MPEHKRAYPSDSGSPGQDERYLLSLARGGCHALLLAYRADDGGDATFKNERADPSTALLSNPSVSKVTTLKGVPCNAALTASRVSRPAAPNLPERGADSDVLP